jgi:hypothetical protein
MLRSCEILTEGALEAALRGQLPADQCAVVLRHLEEPCDACLDLLESWTAEEMIDSSTAPDSLLSRQEQDRLFAVAASGGSPSRRSTVRLVPPRRRRFPALAWGVAAAAVALVALVMVVRPDSRDPNEGLKGGPAPVATLVPLVGARTPTPHVVRALAPGGKLAGGEVLLLRIRLGAPAWVYLLSQKEGEATEILWPLKPAARHEPGEFELAESGSALAIDPETLGRGARLLLIASPEAIREDRLRVREPFHTRADLEKTFPGCGVDVLPVLFESR